MVLCLPFPPTVNTYWRNLNGRTIISAKGRQFKKNVHQRLLLQATECLHGRLSVQIELTPPDARKRDVDNYCKAVLDALTGICYEDDSQIDRLLVVRRPPARPGRCRVTIGHD